jgi:hypothetical protein
MNVPKIIKKHKKSQTIQNFLNILQSFFKNSLECPIFWITCLNFTQVVQTFCVILKTLPMWTIQWRLKLTLSYYYICSLVWMLWGLVYFLYFSCFKPPINKGLNGIKISFFTDLWCESSHKVIPFEVSQ